MRQGFSAQVPVRCAHLRTSTPAFGPFAPGVAQVFHVPFNDTVELSVPPAGGTLGPVLCVCVGVRGGTTLEPLGWAGHTLGVVLLIIGGIH